MKKLLSFLVMLIIAIFSFANNVVISNVSLVGPTNFHVKFDLSWDNGWRVSTGQVNYDGVWVFFKYRVGGGPWQHLGMLGIGNVLPANCGIFQNTTVKRGAMIFRTDNFTGTTTFTNI